MPMLCKNPYMAGSIPYGCGQCLPCRINRRRQWNFRQFFESLCHDENSFLTLTYSDENLPADGSVRVSDVQLFLKRFRRQLGEHRIRFFAVGEYGDLSWRPHYHLSVFGVSGTTVVGNQTVEQITQRCWPAGFIKYGDFNLLTAQYVTGYVTKKMTKPEDERLNGKAPEFATMSRRPGLGYDAMLTIAKSLCESGHGMDLLERGDIPRELQIGKRKIPLGRYLLHKLREAVGFTDEYIKTIKDRISEERSTELLALFQAALLNEEAFTIKEAHQNSITQQVRNVEGRYKLRRQQESL